MKKDLIVREVAAVSQPVELTGFHHRKRRKGFRKNEESPKKLLEQKSVKM